MGIRTFGSMRSIFDRNLFRRLRLCFIIENFEIIPVYLFIESIQCLVIRIERNYPKSNMVIKRLAILTVQSS